MTSSFNVGCVLMFIVLHNHATQLRAKFLAFYWYYSITVTVTGIATSNNAYSCKRMSYAYFEDNFECWLNSFSKFGSKLVTYEIYSSVLEDEKIQDRKEMIIWSMFGNFKCHNCRWSWSSTQCSTEISYGYNELRNRAELVVEKEFGQACRRCNRFVLPVFDQEATDKAISKAVERIKKVMYNLTAPGNDSSDRHSRARDRKKPHDSMRCEACMKGVCSYGKSFGNASASKSRPYNFDDRYHGTLTKTRWSFFYGEQFGRTIPIPNGKSKKSGGGEDNIKANSSTESKRKKNMGRKKAPKEQSS